MADVVLEARGVGYSYGARAVLTEVSFAVRRGEIFGLLGPNGAGKSTLFGILSGLLAPRTGALLAGGQPVDPRSRAYRARLGVVFQQPSLDLKLSGRENLQLGASLYGVPRGLARERIERALALTELGERARDKVEKYSGGMRRRLELARVLLHEPELLIMDEPTQGLDLASARRLWRHLGELRAERSLTILLTTHDPVEAESADRLLILDQGRVVAEGSPAELTARADLGGDIITVEGDEPAALASALSAGLGVSAKVTEPETPNAPPVVTFTAPRGHELVPRVVELFPAGRLRAVQVRPPSLGDAFLRLTGRTLAGDSAGVAA